MDHGMANGSLLPSSKSSSSLAGMIHGNAANTMPIIECSVPKVHFRSEAKGEVVYYEVRTKTTHQRRVYNDVAIKRFSDFTNLAAAVRRNFPREILPEAPKKKVWGANDRAFVQRRRLELENYLIALLNFGSPGHAVRTCEDLRAFLPEQAFIGIEKKSHSAGFVTFDVSELNRFNQKSSGQLLSISTSQQLLTITPRGSGAADGKDKMTLRVTDIASLVEVEGSSTRIALLYYEPSSVITPPIAANTTNPSSSSAIAVPSSSSSTTTASSGLSHSPNGTGGLASTSPPRTAASGVTTPSSPSVAHSNGIAAASTLMPRPAVTPTNTNGGIANGSNNNNAISNSNGVNGIKPRKKMYEFSSLDDRQRFCRMYRSIEPDRGPQRASRVGGMVHGTGSPQFANVSVWCTSWNLAKEPPPDDLNGWIPLWGGGHGIICIGVQECHMTLAAFQAMFEKQLGPGYYLVAKKSLWEIKIFVFARNNLRIGEEISGVETSSVATGIMGIMGNKGGVAVALRLHTLSLCFVNAHLAAHTEKNADRHRMFEEIDSGLKVGNNELDMTMQFDHLFWIGDLNYRIELPPEQIVTYIGDKKWTELFLRDQLLQGMIKQESFAGFSEGVIDFAPTYKFKMPKGHGRKRSHTVKKPVNQRTNHNDAKDLIVVDEDDEDSDGDDSFKAGSAVTHGKKNHNSNDIPLVPISAATRQKHMVIIHNSNTSAANGNGNGNAHNEDTQVVSTTSSLSSTSIVATSTTVPSSTTATPAVAASTTPSSSLSSSSSSTDLPPGGHRVAIVRVKPPIPSKPPTASSVAHSHAAYAGRMSRAVRPGVVKELVGVYAAKDAAAISGAPPPLSTAARTSGMNINISGNSNTHGSNNGANMTDEQLLRQYGACIMNDCHRPRLPGTKALCRFHMLRHDELVAKGIDVNVPSSASSRDASPPTTASSSPTNPNGDDILSASLASVFPMANAAPPTDDDFLDLPPSRQRAMTDMGPIGLPAPVPVTSSTIHQSSLLSPMTTITPSVASSSGLAAALLASRNAAIAAAPSSTASSSSSPTSTGAVFHARHRGNAPPAVATQGGNAVSASLPVGASVLLSSTNNTNNTNGNTNMDPFEPVSPSPESPPNPSHHIGMDGVNANVNVNVNRRRRGGPGGRRGGGGNGTATVGSVEQDAPFPMDHASDDDSLYSESDGEQKSDDEDDDGDGVGDNSNGGTDDHANDTKDSGHHELSSVSTTDTSSIPNSHASATPQSPAPAPSESTSSSATESTPLLATNDSTDTSAVAVTPSTVTAPVPARVAPPLPRTGPTLHLRPSRATLSGINPVTGGVTTTTTSATVSTSSNTSVVGSDTNAAVDSSSSPSSSSTDEASRASTGSTSAPGHHKTTSILSQLLRAPDEFTSPRQRSPAIYQSDRPPLPQSERPVVPAPNSSSSSSTSSSSSSSSSTSSSSTGVSTTVGSLPATSRLSTAPKQVTFNTPPDTNDTNTNTNTNSNNSGNVPANSTSPVVEISEESPAKKHNRKRSSTEPLRNRESSSSSGGTTLYRMVIPPGGGPPVKVINRGYTMKKEPSWCDRILWRSIFDRHCRQSSYYRCEGLYTSDHLPVASLFNLFIPLPPPIWVYSTSATITLSDLYIDFTPSNPRNNARVEKKIYTGGQVYITFFGSALAETSRGKRTPPATITTELKGYDSQSSVARWATDDTPVLKPIVGTPSWLALEKIYFLVRLVGNRSGRGTGVDEVLGQGVIKFEGLQPYAALSNTPIITPPPVAVATPTPAPSGVSATASPSAASSSSALSSTSASVALSSNGVAPVIGDDAKTLVPLPSSSSSPPVIPSSSSSDAIATVIDTSTMDNASSLMTPVRWQFKASLEQHSSSCGHLSGYITVDFA